MPPGVSFGTARAGATIVFALAVAAVVALAIAARPAKRMVDFDQSFYLTIAYDLDRHGVFSNGIFDSVDSTKEVPPPGMFFAPLYPALALAVMKLDPRFERAVICSVEVNHGVRDGAQCEVYARPMHLVHAAFLTLGVLAIAFAAQIILANRRAFWASGILAVACLLPDADLFSFVMTESVTFGLYGLFGLALVAALRPGEARYAG